MNATISSIMPRLERYKCPSCDKVINAHQKNTRKDAICDGCGKHKIGEFKTHVTYNN